MIRTYKWLTGPEAGPDSIHAFLVLSVLGIIATVLAASVAILGSYFLTIYEVKHAEYEQTVVQANTEIQSSIPQCKAMIELDKARDGAQFAPASRTGVPLSRNYGYRLANRLHAVIENTHCDVLIRDVQANVPPLQIINQIDRLDKAAALKRH